MRLCRVIGCEVKSLEDWMLVTLSILLDSTSLPSYQVTIGGRQTYRTQLVQHEQQQLLNTLKLKCMDHHIERYLQFTEQIKVRFIPSKYGDMLPLTMAWSSRLLLMSIYCGLSVRNRQEEYELARCWILE